jgi:hypothetical protein
MKGYYKTLTAKEYASMPAEEFARRLPNAADILCLPGSWELMIRVATLTEPEVNHHADLYIKRYGGEWPIKFPISQFEYEALTR